MSDYRRAYQPGGVYFFTVVTHQRTPVFTTEQRIAFLRNAFKKVMQSRPFSIDAIVVLPEHLHCIWRLPENDADYSSRWREIKKSVTQQIKASGELSEAPVWQRRFWEHLIRDEDDWRKHVDYIHYNPVKHRLANRPDDWPWSSFRNAVRKNWYASDWGTEEPPTLIGMNSE